MGIRRWLRELTASTEELAVLGAVEAAPACSIGDLPDEIVGRISGVVHELDSAHVISPLTRNSTLDQLALRGQVLRCTTADRKWEREREHHS